MRNEVVKQQLSTELELARIEDEYRDLMAPRIELAHRLHPGIEWSVGSAYQLPYQDAAFDLVMSSFVFSSILSEPLRQKVTEEMWRVRKPAGLILFHNFMYSNPQNLAVQGITYQNIRQLFRRTGAKFDFRRIIMAPSISQIVALLAYWMAYALEQLKILNTHTILLSAWIRQQDVCMMLQ